MVVVFLPQEHVASAALVATAATFPSAPTARELCAMRSDEWVVRGGRAKQFAAGRHHHGRRGCVVAMKAPPLTPDQKKEFRLAKRRQKERERRAADDFFNKGLQAALEGSKKGKLGLCGERREASPHNDEKIEVRSGDDVDTTIISAIDNVLDSKSRYPVSGALAVEDYFEIMLQRQSSQLQLLS